LEEATIRLARAKRQEREQEQAQDIEIGLQGLRRRFALIEQGFILTTNGIRELRAVSNDINRFLGDNLVDLAQGVQVSYGKLFAEINASVGELIAGKFANLQAQLAKTKQGFEAFKTASTEAAGELANAEAGPHEKTSKDILDRAKKNFDSQIATLQGFVTEAQNKLVEAQASKDQQQIGRAIFDLTEAQDKLAESSKTAQEAFDFEAQNAAIEAQIALIKRQTVEQQTQVRINAEAKKIREDQLRIEQQLLQEAGNLAKQVQGGRGQVVQLQQQAQASEPRTELQSQLSGLETSQVQLQASLEATRAGLNQLSEAASALAETGDPAAQATLDLIDAQLMEVDTLRASAESAYNQARANIQLQVTLDALGNATRSTLNTMLDAVLGAFEGKKTNLVAAFKGIADNMVKDALKNTFDSLVTGMQKGFKKAFESLTEGMPEDLTSSLGPAFMAGFGLLASFVLGQLMGDHGGEGTAGNPTVGIQSTEQVRGLIGGETQIPIGQIGESLQDALVPTNLLLARIARAVEGQVSGFSTAQIEGIIERAVGETLQIQGA
jgi:hypothetical protein